MNEKQLLETIIHLLTKAINGVQGPEAKVPYNLNSLAVNSTITSKEVVDQPGLIMNCYGFYPLNIEVPFYMSPGNGKDRIKGDADLKVIQMGVLIDKLFNTISKSRPNGFRGAVRITLDESIKDFF